jgi:ABC-type sugar transport system ATPase subunit
MITLEVEELSKAFGATKAMSGVSFRLQGGQVLALLGENGAGKSTLIKILCGVHQADSGLIRLDGQTARFASPQHAIRAGIVQVPQELRVVPSLSVAHNIMLGQLPTRKIAGLLPALDRSRMLDRTRSVLGELDIDIDPATPAGQLGFAERQLIVIARALAHDAKILILDEPTASLEKRETQRLFEVIKRSRSKGLAIIYISHKLEEIPLIADQCMVMRDGRVTRFIANPPFPTASLVEAMTGQAWTEHQAELIVSENLRETFEISDASVQLHRGQVLGLGGLLGSGASTVLHRLFGAQSDRAGASGSVRRAIASGRGLVPAERARSLVASLSVRDNIVLPHLHRYASPLVRNERSINEAVGRMMDLLDIRPRSPSALVRTLSGGNQQKVAFAKWLVGELEVLLLDEPTNGIDIAAKARLHASVRDFIAAGGSVVLSSSDLKELLELSHEIVVLRQGQVIDRMRRDAQYGESKLRQLLGVG